MTEKRIFTEKKNGKWWVVAEKDGLIVSEKQVSSRESADQIVRVAQDQLAKESSTAFHKFVHSLTDTEPPAPKASGSLKKCVRTYDLV